MTITADARSARSLPALGGFSPTMVRPGTAPDVPQPPYRDLHPDHAGGAVPAVRHGGELPERALGGGNVAGYILVSMAVYGAMLATTAGGAMVSIERAVGWSRQLRLTPLRPAAYIVVKLVVAMTVGAVSVAVAFAVGAVTGAELPGTAWLECGLLAWVCALVFAAFGLFMGYLLPSENVMQILGPVLGILAFAGGLFVPVDQLGTVFATIAKFTPVYGVGEIARYPLVHQGSLAVGRAQRARLDRACSRAGAVWRFRRDTARV